MIRSFLVCLFIAPALATAAGPTTRPDRSERIAFELAPTPPGEPLLQNRLTVDPLKLKSGNAALFYYRAMIDVPAGVEVIDAALDDRDAGKPLAGNAKLDDFLKQCNPVFDDMVAGACRLSCDWGELSPDPDGVDRLLPLLSHARQLANILEVRGFREIEAGKVADAIQTIRTESALAGAVRQKTPLIGVLVAVAIDSVARKMTIELMKRPNTPNLYWPLRVTPDCYSRLPVTFSQEREWGSISFSPGRSIPGFDRQFEAMHDEIEAALTCSPSECLRQLDRLQTHAAGNSNREAIASVALPAMRGAILASVRHDRERAALITVEAIRCYAAAHGGGLPKSLADLTDTPASCNPATGATFGYNVDGQTATITDDDSPVALDGRPLLFTLRMGERNAGR